MSSVESIQNLLKNQDIDIFNFNYISDVFIQDHIKIAVKKSIIGKGFQKDNIPLKSNSCSLRRESQINIWYKCDLTSFFHQKQSYIGTPT